MGLNHKIACSDVAEMVQKPYPQLLEQAAADRPRETNIPLRGCEGGSSASLPLTTEQNRVRNTIFVQSLVVGRTEAATETTLLSAIAMSLLT